MSTTANPIRRGLSQEFRPSLLSCLLVVALVPVFVSLGNWQMGKAESRIVRQQQLDARVAGPLLEVRDLSPALADVEYRTVRLRGEYASQGQFLLDNQYFGDQAGYAVITPLALAGGGLILVNRGWLPFGSDRSQLPTAPLPSRIEAVEGLAVAPPRTGFALAGASNAGAVHASIDLAATARQLGGAVAPWMVLLKPGRDDAFAMAWPKPAERVQTNIGYAWQWYGFATASVAIFAVLGRRRARASAGVPA
jgi:surfeit locus 1 family protein